MRLPTDVHPPVEGDEIDGLKFDLSAEAIAAAVDREHREQLYKSAADRKRELAIAQGHMRHMSTLEIDGSGQGDPDPLRFGSDSDEFASGSDEEPQPFAADTGRTGAAFGRSMATNSGRRPMAAAPASSSHTPARSMQTGGESGRVDESETERMRSAPLPGQGRNGAFSSSATGGAAFFGTAASSSKPGERPATPPTQSPGASSRGNGSPAEATCTLSFLPEEHGSVGGDLTASGTHRSGDPAPLTEEEEQMMTFIKAQLDRLEKDGKEEGPKWTNLDLMRQKLEQPAYRKSADLKELYKIVKIPQNKIHAFFSKPKSLAAFEEAFPSYKPEKDVRKGPSM